MRRTLPSPRPTMFPATIEKLLALIDRLVEHLPKCMTLAERVEFRRRAAELVEEIISGLGL